ncbi:hypothetical protein DFH06DRAFT_1153075 [Mycena polygramma]|nr:hypothetical protein DFH06DRAFT_1153075 [Mycena polygramma]
MGGAKAATKLNIPANIPVQAILTDNAVNNTRTKDMLRVYLERLYSSSSKLSDVKEGMKGEITGFFARGEDVRGSKCDVGVASGGARGQQTLAKVHEGRCLGCINGLGIDSPEVGDACWRRVCDTRAVQTHGGGCTYVARDDMAVRLRVPVVGVSASPRFTPARISRRRPVVRGCRQCAHTITVPVWAMESKEGMGVCARSAQGRLRREASSGLSTSGLPAGFPFSDATRSQERAPGFCRTVSRHGRKCSAAWLTEVVMLPSSLPDKHSMCQSPIFVLLVREDWR